MRYFFIKQDIFLPKAIKLRDIDIAKGRYIFKKSESETLRDMTPLYLVGSGLETRPDYITYPSHIFSERLREILEAHEESLEFKDVVMIHKENSLQYRYVLVLMDELDVISDDTEYYPNQTIKKLVLDPKKIGQHQIFMLDGKNRKDIIASMPVVESLLRRNVIGIEFEEIEVSDV